MSTHDTAAPIPRGDDAEILAEVIELRGADTPSFYQRNSGALPRAEAGLTDAHRRNQLPTPDNTDTTTVKDRLLGFLNR